MTKLKIFEAVMKKAKANGYTGPSAEYELGRIVNGTNVYAIIFREDFAKALWGEWVISNLSMSTDEDMFKITALDSAIWYWPRYKKHVVKLSLSEDKWKYLEENALD